MTKGVRQSSVRKFLVCYLNFCLYIAKLLYSLTVLKYLDNDDLISSKTSLNYKQYIPIIIAKQYTVIQSQGVKYIKVFRYSSLAIIDMHYFCSLISFSILFRNTVFLFSILEMKHYKLAMNSCIRYFFWSLLFHFISI